MGNVFGFFCNKSRNLLNVSAGAVTAKNTYYM